MEHRANLQGSFRTPEPTEEDHEIREAAEQGDVNRLAELASTHLATTRAAQQRAKRNKLLIYTTMGWTWARACSMLDRGEEPRRSDMAAMLEEAREQLKLPWNPVQG